MEQIINISFAQKLICENNLLIAIKAVERQQDITRGPTCWMAYEEELVELRKKLEELKHGTSERTVSR